ncbi:MAG: HlyD family type I secretion periplasmic adaptor subunit [Pseudomonadota bacterium]
MRETFPIELRRLVMLGLVIILTAFGGFGTWAAVAQIASAVVSQGTVKVFTNRKKVQSLEGGVVTALNIKNGDYVQTGDVLLTLDRTRAAASHQIIQGNYDTTRASIARLNAERDQRDAIMFPGDLRSRANAPAVAEILASQEKMFRARQETYFGEVAMVEERIGQLREEIRGLEKQATAKQKQIQLIEDELAGLYELLEKGYTARTRVLALEREASSLEGEAGEHIASIARAKRAISEAELEILQLRKARIEQIVIELQDQETQLFDLEERLGAASYTLEQTDLRATSSGYVVGLAVHTVGGVVQPGETVLEIVPHDDDLIVEAKVQPIDIDSVQLGLDADVQFTAFSQRSTPKLSGKVIYVSADSMVEPNRDLPFYIARISVPEQEVARLGENPLLPGMPADVLIKTGSRTPLTYFLKPIKDSMNKAWRES